MPFISPSDITFSLIPEATFATTPTTGATRYELPVKADQAPLAYSTNNIDSETKRPNRSSNGSRRGMGQAQGSFEFRLSNATYLTPLFQSALSGTFVSKVLKGGSTDTTFSVLCKLIDGAAGSALVQQVKGCMVNSMTISGEQNAEVNVSFELMGAARDMLTTDNALAVAAVPNTAVEFIGKEVTAFNVAGNTSLNVSAFELVVGHERALRGVFGSDAGVGFGTSGTRGTTLELTVYRESGLLETLTTGAAQAVSFQIGSTGNGWSISLPAAYIQVPQDSLDGESAFVTLNMTAGYDATSGTDIIITQL